MKCLVIGSGGREHTLAWKMAQSSHVRNLFIAPGNAGTSEIGTNIPVPAEDVPALLSLAQKEMFDLTVVGPEAPLSEGIVNTFQKAGLPVFGPTREATQLENSKSFAKEFLSRHRIPTADFQSAASDSEAADILKEWGDKPAVIKADGLAAGKGVFICDKRKEKEDALRQIFKEKIFGPAGEKVVIEEKLEGEEASFLVITDGKKYYPFPSAQDHKKIGENDTGPNTGGMGAIVPNPFLSDTLQQEIIREIIEPTVTGLLKDGIVYRGILYAGLILTREGPRVLEFNARFGDPETQVLLPLLESDLFELLLSSAQGRLIGHEPNFRKGATCCVVLASEGYPGQYQKNKEIFGLKAFSNDKNVMVFHAGTRKENRKVYTNGGRVLGVTGVGDNLSEAIEKAYRGVNKISFEGAYFRRDIGRKGLTFKPSIC